MVANEFKNISNRGRVAYAICCLENALIFYGYDRSAWDFVLKQLWSFCHDDMAIWQEKTGELIPFAVQEEIDFETKHYQYLTRDEHDLLQRLYKGSNEIILQILELIYDIGITNVLVRIDSEPLRLASLPYLKDIISLMEDNKITLPEVGLFEKFPITENQGWGREFTKEEIFK